MFERYTERARRVLFFARYEASQLGSISIETEHLLLGLVREGDGVAGKVLAELSVGLEALRGELLHALREEAQPGTDSTPLTGGFSSMGLVVSEMIMSN